MVEVEERNFMKVDSPKNVFIKGAPPFWHFVGC